MADFSRLPGPNADLWDWQLLAACRGVDSSLFFHPEGERGAARSARENSAKEVCMRCPVRAQCAAHALAVREPYGVWGGLTEDEREELMGRARNRLVTSPAGAAANGGAAAAPSAPSAAPPGTPPRPSVGSTGGLPGHANGTPRATGPYPAPHDPPPGTPHSPAPAPTAGTAPASAPTPSTPPAPAPLASPDAAPAPPAGTAPAPAPPAHQQSTPS